MGKRHGGLAGLSRFVLEAFKNTSTEESSPSFSNDLKTLDDSSGVKSLELAQGVDDRPAKKRKTNEGSAVGINARESLGAQWIDKYEATGLVPHYKHASEVPEHLQKCTHCS